MFQLFFPATGESSFVEVPRFVRLVDTVWLQCDEVNAQCLAFHGKLYSLNPTADGPPEVIVRKIDASLPLNNFIALSNFSTDEIKAAIYDIYDALFDIYFERKV